MKTVVAFSFLSTFLTKIPVASSEAAIDNDWTSDDILSNTYSNFDPVSSIDDGYEGSMWDENPINDADLFYTEFLAGADGECSQNIEPSGKRRTQNYCASSPVPQADFQLALPKSPFETLEPKNPLNLDLEPIRFLGGTPQFAQMDNIYCDN